MKKTISLLCIFVLAVSLLCACGGKKEPETQPQTKEAVQPTEKQTEEQAKEPLDSAVRSVRFYMDADGLKRKLSYCIDEAEDAIKFGVLDNVFYLCDEGLSYGKRFTGALVGMFVYEGEKELTVSFREDRYNVI